MRTKRQLEAVIKICSEQIEYYEKRKYPKIVKDFKRVKAQAEKDLLRLEKTRS